MENDVVYAEKTLKVQEKTAQTGSSKDQMSKGSQSTKSDIVCTHYIHGRCRYGFSGQKKDESGNTCKFAHPKICDKLYKYGTHVVLDLILFKFTGE